MRKQFLSFVCLSVITLVHPVTRAFADPTEDADRRFLSNLENGGSPQATPAPPVATPVKPPVVSSSAPVAAPAPAPVPAPRFSNTRAVVQPQDAPAVSAEPSAPVARAVKPRPAPQSQETAKHPHERIVQNRVQQPAEIAEADPQSASQTPATRSVKRTRERVVSERLPQPMTVEEVDPQPAPQPVTQTKIIIFKSSHDSDHDRDHDKNGFFHRLFSHNSHPEDW